jgi:3-oxoisoapionate decarboxylase
MGAARSHAMSRRAALGRIAMAAGVAVLGQTNPVYAEEKKRLGLADFSYIVRQSKDNKSAKAPRFTDAIAMLQHLSEIGAGGVQTGVRGWQLEFAKKVRDARERLGLYLEGQVSLPKTEADVARFTADVEAAKEAGAGVVRTVFMGGRRYEVFDAATPFKKFKEDSWTSLQLAEPVVKKLRMRLAIENHKDLRSDELIDYLKRISSEYVGVTLDTGNNIALLEDADKVVDALAPYTFSIHLKDMAVDEYEEGFLISEVVLGTGFLDLKRIVDVCRRANPGVQFNLEMPARDPLKVPCLTPKYWATFENLPGVHLADTLAMIKKRKAKTPLPRVSQMSLEEKLVVEEDNIAKSLAYARENLGL